MLPITLEYNDGSIMNFNSIDAFTKHLGIPQSTFCSLIKKNRTKMTNNTKTLENKKVTVHYKDHDKILEFGQYIPTDYNRSHICECGVSHYYRDRKRHAKSKYHQNWLNNVVPEEVIKKPFVNNNEKMICDCGVTTTKRMYKRHCNSIRHKNHMTKVE